MKVLSFIDQILHGIFSPKPHYKPIIPPHTRAQMQQYNISEKELVGAFYSRDIKPGYKTGATLGCANYYGKVVCAAYKKDDHNPME